MQIQHGNITIFNGKLSIRDLSRKQKEIFDTITPMLEKEIKPTKNLNLNISGDCCKNFVEMYFHREPKFLHISTQITDDTIPITSATIEGVERNTVVKTIRKLISTHINSEAYKNCITQKTSLKDKIIALLYK